MEGGVVYVGRCGLLGGSDMCGWNLSVWVVVICVGGSGMCGWKWYVWVKVFLWVELVCVVEVVFVGGGCLCVVGGVLDVGCWCDGSCICGRRWYM